MGMFPRFIQSLVATGGCCAASLCFVCLLGSTAFASTGERVTSSVSRTIGVSKIFESEISQNTHPVGSDVGRPNGGTGDTGTR